MKTKDILWIAAGLGAGYFFFLRPKLASASINIPYLTSQASVTTTPTATTQTALAPTQTVPGISYRDDNFSVLVPFDQIINWGQQLLFGTKDTTKDGASKVVSSVPVDSISLPAPDSYWTPLS